MVAFFVRVLEQELHFDCCVAAVVAVVCNTRGSDRVSSNRVIAIGKIMRAANRNLNVIKM